MPRVPSGNRTRRRPSGPGETGSPAAEAPGKGGALNTWCPGKANRRGDTSRGIPVTVPTCWHPRCDVVPPTQGCSSFDRPTGTGPGSGPSPRTVPGFFRGRSPCHRRPPVLGVHRGRVRRSQRVSVTPPEGIGRHPFPWFRAPPPTFPNRYALFGIRFRTGDGANRGVRRTRWPIVVDGHAEPVDRVDGQENRGPRERRLARHPSGPMTGITRRCRGSLATHPKRGLSVGLRHTTAPARPRQDRGSPCRAGRPGEWRAPTPGHVPE